MNELLKFVDQHRVDKGANFSHTSLGYPKGSFYVPSDRTDEFLDIYSSTVANADLFFTERHKEVCPVVVDLDFKYNGCDMSRRYTARDVEAIVSMYVRAMAALLTIQYPVRAVVMEKPSPVLYNGGVKDGLHIVFPDIVTPAIEQYMLRSDILKRIAIVLDHLRPSNAWSDVVDDSVISRNNWMMYGSKKPNCEAYLVSRVLLVDEQFNVTHDTDARDARDFAYWVPELSIRNKFATVEPLDSRRSDLFALEEAMNTRQLQSMARSRAAASNQLIAPSSRIRNNDDYETARKFVAILSVERADSYTTWIKVGWCLFNIDERLLEDWVQFSKRSSKFKEGECERMWSSDMRRDALGMGSLSMWAKEDSPDAHAEINKQRILSLIMRSCSGDQATHHDVAVVVYTMYRHKFVCSSIRSKSWYEFRDHRWRVSDSAYTLRKLISTEVFSEYVAAGAYFQERASVNARDGDESSHTDSQKCLERVKKINVTALKLKNVSFKESLVKELSELFFQEGFEEKLNSHGNLLGFENGVYDLDTGVFRDGQPEDYVSFSVGYDYLTYDAQHPVVAEIQDFFAKVFTNQALRLYVIQTLASCIHGGIRYERYNVWHGEQGANGKSKLLDLVEQTLGDYAVKFPVSLLTQKRVASNAATSELARSKGRRFASMQEPGEHETLNIGIMKELSGNDKIVARHLFHEAIEFRPFFKMFLCCNHLPSVPSQDGGTWRRIRVVRFHSRFCEKPDPANENEFEVDYDIDRKFEIWKPHMIGFLISHLSKVRNGIPEPAEVMEYTMNYKRSNDSISEFFDTYVRTATPESSVTLSALIQTYRGWRKKEGMSTSNIVRAEFKVFADKYFGVKSKDRREAWFGYRLMTDEEEAEEARRFAMENGEFRDTSS